MASKSTVSDVWKFFSKSQSDKSLVVCTLCRTGLKYSYSSTSNLKKHLLRKHPCDYMGVEVSYPPSASASLPTTTPTTTTTTSPNKPSTSGSVSFKMKQPTLKATVERTRLYPQGSEKKKELDGLVMAMIVKDTQPFSIVEDRGFRELVKGLDPRYRLPSRKHLTKELLPRLYEEVKLMVKQLLLSVNHISVTTDIWSSRATEGYITMTAHFITGDFQMTSFVLSTVRMSQTHTAVNIASEMKAIFETWEIENKIQAVVTDNASNMLAAVNHELGDDVESVSCFAHTLNLVVQESVKNTTGLNAIRKKVKEIVSFFRHSIKATDKLKQLQGVEKRLIQDVPTRWNSTLAMIKRYCEEHQTVTSALCRLSRSDMCVSDLEVETMKIAIEALEPFHLVTEEMSSETKVTLSKKIPFVKLLLKSLAQSPYHDFPLVMELRRQLVIRFSSLDRNFVACASTMLDPRFKGMHFTQDAFIRTQAAIKKKLEAEYDKIKTLEPPTAATVASDPCQPPPKKKKSIWDSHDEELDQLRKNAPTQISGPETELRRYFESQPLVRHEDPLLWWQENKEMLPELAKLAKRYLGIPATSVPSERLFSKAGELISARRSSLKDKHVDKLLFLNKNVK